MTASSLPLRVVPEERAGWVCGLPDLRGPFSARELFDGHTSGSACVWEPVCVCSPGFVWGVANTARVPRSPSGHGFSDRFLGKKAACGCWAGPPSSQEGGEAGQQGRGGLAAQTKRFLQRFHSNVLSRHFLSGSAEVPKCLLHPTPSLQPAPAPGGHSASLANWSCLESSGLESSRLECSVGDSALALMKGETVCEPKCVVMGAGVLVTWGSCCHQPDAPEPRLGPHVSQMQLWSLQESHTHACPHTWKSKHAPSSRDSHGCPSSSHSTLPHPSSQEGRTQTELRLQDVSSPPRLPQPGPTGDRLAA